MSSKSHAVGALFALGAESLIRRVFAAGIDNLQATADTSAAVIGFQLNFNTLAKAAIMGLYKH